MYNTPRACSIRANEECVLYVLDRETFNAIVKDSTIKRREKYQSFLSKVDILHELSDYEREKISDVLVNEVFNKGESVIRQGEPGNKIYFIEEGRAEAIQSQGR